MRRGLGKKTSLHFKSVVGTSKIVCAESFKEVSAEFATRYISTFYLGLGLQHDPYRGFKCIDANHFFSVIHGYVFRHPFRKHFLVAYEGLQF